MDISHRIEELVDFYRLVTTDRFFAAYTRDADKLCRLLASYSTIRAAGGRLAHRVDWEPLRSHCEYFAIKLGFDRRDEIKKRRLPEALAIFARLDADERDLRQLLSAAAYAFKAILSAGTCPETLRPPKLDCPRDPV